MHYAAETPEQYIEQIPPERKEAFIKLRNTILENLPKDFEETMQYGMISYVVPHSIYPAGYHTDPKQALPFLSIASQKNFIAVYHMGIYAKEQLLNWFTSEYPKYVKTKLDMGKSCIRLKNTQNIPYALLGELVSKVSVREWIDIYENANRKK